MLPAAVGEVLPQLKGKLDGMAVRVPTSNVSVVDLVAKLKKNASEDEINSAMKAASQGALKGVLDYTEEPLVSIDFNGSPFSSTFDAKVTKVMDGNFVKVLSWYDNEWGFSNRMGDVAAYIGSKLIEFSFEGMAPAMRAIPVSLSLDNDDNRSDRALGETSLYPGADLNVPLDGHVVSDTTRIEAALPTLRYALEKGARVVLASHLGRPKGTAKPEFSLAPVAKKLSGILGSDMPLAPDCIGNEVREQVDALQPGHALLLQNLRFHPGEEANDPAFAQALAELADVYVNDAFGAAHRAHASTVGMASLVGSRAAGFLLKKECDYLGKVLGDPSRPVVAILGGAKVSDKARVVDSLIDKVDSILIGGAMAYTFLRAQGVKVGASLVEKEMIAVATAALSKAADKGVKILLPCDHVVASSIESDKADDCVLGDIPEGMIGLDVGPRTVVSFRHEIATANTIFWNGPLGLFEREAFRGGTMAMADALAESSAGNDRRRRRLDCCTPLFPEKRIRSPTYPPAAVPHWSSSKAALYRVLRHWRPHHDHKAQTLTRGQLENAGLGRRSQ